MSEGRASPADREQQLEEQLAEVQRAIRELFPVSNESLDLTNPVQGKPLRREERTRLHARREEIRAELDELRVRRIRGEG